MLLSLSFSCTPSFSQISKKLKDNKLCEDESERESEWECGKEAVYERKRDIW